MTLYVVYSRFVDDASEVKGIFSTQVLAEEALARWKEESNEIGYVEDFTLDEFLEGVKVLA